MDTVGNSISAAVGISQTVAEASISQSRTKRSLGILATKRKKASKEENRGAKS